MAAVEREHGGKWQPPSGKTHSHLFASLVYMADVSAHRSTSISDFQFRRLSIQGTHISYDYTNITNHRISHSCKYKQSRITYRACQSTVQNVEWYIHTLIHTGEHYTGVTMELLQN